MTDSASLVSEKVKEWIGHEYEPQTFKVTALDIAKFAHATGENNPIHFKRVAARRAGYRDIVAPRKFYHAIAIQAAHLVAKNQLGTDGTAELKLPVETGRVMAGESSIRWGGNIYAGDTITLFRTVSDIYQKQGRSGTLVFVKTRHQFVNQLGKTVVEEDSTRIIRK